MYRFIQTCSPFKNAFKLTKCYRAFFLIQVEFIGHREMIIEQRNHRDSKPGACELNVLCFHTNFVFYTHSLLGDCYFFKTRIISTFWTKWCITKIHIYKFYKKI